MEEITGYLDSRGAMTYRESVESIEHTREAAPRFWRQLGFLELLGQIAPPELRVGDEHIILDRAAAALAPQKGYEQTVLLPSDKLVVVPYSIDDALATGLTDDFWERSMLGSIFVDQYELAPGGWKDKGLGRAYGGIDGPFALIAPRHITLL